MKRAFLPVTFLVLLAAGCGGSSSGSSSSETGGGGGKKTIAGVPANDHGSKNVSSEAEVELDDFCFEPTVLRGKPGSQVTLELRNEGSTEHNLTIDSQSIDKDVEAGEDAKSPSPSRSQASSPSTASTTRTSGWPGRWPRAEPAR
jgi:plastocyanin